MTPLTWMLGQGVFGDRLAEAAEILSRQGDSVRVLASVDEHELPLDQAGPAFAMTSIQGMRRLQRSKAWPALCPGAYFDDRAYKVSSWLPRMHPAPSQDPSSGRWAPLALNERSLWLPWGLLRTSTGSDLLRDGLGLGGRDPMVFLRPDSGLKPFTGQTVPLKGMQEALDLLSRSHGRIDDDLLVVAAPAVRLATVEWRLWVAERTVIAAAPYSWTWAIDGPEMTALCRAGPPAQVLDQAARLIALPWQPDLAYVADFALRREDGTARLVEINAVSTSGLYQVDLDRLFTGLRKTIHRELRGEIFREAL